MEGEAKVQSKPQGKRSKMLRVWWWGRGYLKPNRLLRTRQLFWRCKVTFSKAIEGIGAAMRVLYLKLFEMKAPPQTDAKKGDMEGGNGMGGNVGKDGNGGKDGKRVKDGNGGTDGKRVKDGNGVKDGKRVKDGNVGKDGKRVKDGNGGTDGKRVKDGNVGKDGKRVKDGNGGTDGKRVKDGQGREDGASDDDDMHAEEEDMYAEEEDMYAEEEDMYAEEEDMYAEENQDDKPTVGVGGVSQIAPRQMALRPASGTGEGRAKKEEQGALF